MMGLTERQMDCARVIAELTALSGRPPSLREVARDMGVNVSNITRLARGLEGRGWLSRDTRFPQRQLVLNRQPPDVGAGAFVLTEAGRDYLAGEGETTTETRRR